LQVFQSELAACNLPSLLYPRPFFSRLWHSLIRVHKDRDGQQGSKQP